MDIIENIIEKQTDKTREPAARKAWHAPKMAVIAASETESDFVEGHGDAIYPTIAANSAS